jgi:hypothetical protein
MFIDVSLSDGLKAKRVSYKWMKFSKLRQKIKEEKCMISLTLKEWLKYRHL